MLGSNFCGKKFGRLIRDAQTVEESLGWQPQVSRKILPPEEFRQLMIAMIVELRDGHVNITRLSHSVYSLGLFTAMIDSHLYVTGFHKDLFVPTGATRQIQEGDEVIAVNGRSISDITRENLLYIQDGTFESRSISAMEYALVRPNGIFRKLKEGESVEVRFRRKSETFTAHLNWINVAGLRYTQSMYPKSFDLTHVRAANENLPAPFGALGTVRSYFLQGLMANGGMSPGTIVDIGALLNLELTNLADAAAAQSDDDDDDDDETESSYHHKAISAQKIPALAGENPDLLPIKPVNRLMAYTVRFADATFGVLRIPSYAGESSTNELNWIAEILQRFENSVDILIVDQLSNTGGSVHYGTQLLALLAGEKPLKSIMANYRLNETLLYVSGNPEVDQDPLTGKTPGYARDRLKKIEYDRLKEKLERGEQWSGPMPAFATVNPDESEPMGLILPSRSYSFKKPILFLNDNRSGSGGDFVPAILQANHRAVIFGETSAGLGGPVYRQIDSLPGSQMSFRCTMAYCERADGLPIENVGVIPDIYRSIRPADLVFEFSPYSLDVLNTALALARGIDARDVQDHLAKAQRDRDADFTELDHYPEDSPAVLKMQRLFSRFSNSAAFRGAELNLSKNAAVLATAYRTLLAKIGESGQELREIEWTFLRFPIPNSLRLSDTILASLWRKPETINRLREMLPTKALKGDRELRKLVGVLAEVLEKIPGDIRTADSCEQLLSVKKTVRR